MFIKCYQWQFKKAIFTFLQKQGGNQRLSPWESMAESRVCQAWQWILTGQKEKADVEEVDFLVPCWEDMGIYIGIPPFPQRGIKQAQQWSERA